MTIQLRLSVSSWPSRGNPLGGGVDVEEGLALAADTELAETRTDVADLLQRLLVRDPLEGGELVVGPVLVDLGLLAVDNLGDLLGFGDGALDFTGTEGVLGAVGAGGVEHHIVDGVDASLGAWG
jgi:hypothetical protein